MIASTKNHHVALSALFLAITLSFAHAQDTAPPPPPELAQQPATYAADTNNVRAVRLSDVEGKVQVFTGSDQAFDQAQRNMPVMEGMRLVTGADGRVEVQFEDGSVARVTPNSSITLSQLHRNADGGAVTTIDADSGLTYYELNGRAGQYTVRFGPNIVTPADSSIFRVGLDQGAELAVTHGSVHLSDGQSVALDVHTNQSVRFAADNPGQFDLVQSVSSDSWDQWNSDRDQALATLEENATTARAGSGNPDDPAWNDLDYYGDWYNIPGYGEAWAPSGVGSGWDPFASGSWGYYNGVGYAWISGYSWGWWPYHCGAWNYFDTFGWMWFPGNCGWGAIGAGWYPYATVWHRPPGFVLPVRPIPRPWRGPVPRFEQLVSNRNTDAAQQFRSIGEPKPAPRSFNFGAQTIQPEQASLHMRSTGPLGESFTASAERTHPEVWNVPDRSGNLGFGGGSARGAYQPGRTFAPSNNRPSWNTGGRPSEAPHYSAPPPPSAPASHPSSGGSAHPR
jgi:hypothetical protein